MRKGFSRIKIILSPEIPGRFTTRETELIGYSKFKLNKVILTRYDIFENLCNMGKAEREIFILKLEKLHMRHYE